MRATSGMSFASGLWMDFAHTELLWSVRNPSETTRASMFRTWSWASVEGAELAAFSNGILYSRKSIFHCTIKPPRGAAVPANPDLLGRKGLKIHGPLLHTALERNTHGTLISQDTRLPTYGYKPDVESLDICEVVCLLVIEWDEGRDRPEYNPVEDNPGCAGLLLAPADDEGQALGVYERIGFWSNTGDSGDNGVTLRPADFETFWLV